MVSHLEHGRRKRFSLTARLALVASLAAAVSLACSRRAEIDDPKVDELPPVPEVPFPEGGVPVVEDSGVDRAGGDCEERVGQSACAGTNDFTCAFDRWLLQLSETCQTQTGCRTNGWIEVVLGEQGCAAELRMEQPNPEFVGCVTEQLNRHRCGGCAGVSASRFLGAAREGCEPSEIRCSTGELRCPPGLRCEQGLCVDGAGGASGG